MIIFKIILTYIFFLIQLIILFKLAGRVRYKNLCDDMPRYIANMGYIFALNGEKGSGKTTTSAGIIQYLVQYIIHELTERINEIRIQLNHVNFNIVNDLIINNNDKPIEEIKELVLQSKDFFIGNEDLRSLYTNFLGIYKKDNLLRDYVYYFWKLNFRKKFILSKTWLYDLINQENARLLDPTSCEIKNVEQNRNWQLEFGTVEFRDEVQQSDGNALSNSKELKMSGQKDLDGLRRNLGRHLIFKVTTKQDSQDEIALNRRQIDVNLNIYDRSIKCNFPGVLLLFKIYKAIILIFIKLGISFKIFFLKIKKIFKKNTLVLTKDDYLLIRSNEDNYFRRLEKFVFQAEKKFLAFSYLRVRCRKYDRADDVGKKDSSLYDRIILYFPTIYCYGSIDTYEYDCLMEYFSQFDNNRVDEYTSKFDKASKIKQFLKGFYRGKE